MPGNTVAFCKTCSSPVYLHDYDKHNGGKHDLKYFVNPTIIDSITCPVCNTGVYYLSTPASTAPRRRRVIARNHLRGHGDMDGLRFEILLQAMAREGIRDIVMFDSANPPEW